MKFEPLFNNFTAGELSPYLYGRIDVDQFYAGAKTIENFLILPYGGVLRIPGTYFVSEVKNSSRKVVLIPFVFSVEQSYILEFGHQYIRFYMNNGQIMSGGSPYEISSPYNEQDLPYLQFAQNADVMWIVHPNYKPRKLSRTGHTNWTLSEYTPTGDPFTGTNKYPSCVTFHEQRIWFACTREKPQTIWASKSGNFENMTTGSNDDDGLEYTIASGEVNVIRWLLSKRVLFVGTSGGILRLGSEDATSPITPTNVVVQRENNEGCYNLMPILTGTNIYYIHRDGRRIMQLSYDYDSDSYLSQDVSILCPHITESGFVRMAYQQSPYNIIYLVRNDGEVVLLTVNVLHKVLGYSRFVTDGVVESIASIPRADGDYNEVWIVVRRTINGQTRRYIEYFTNPEPEYVEDMFYVHCGLTYDGATPVNEVSGLGHLEGKEVAVLVDGAVHPNVTVSGGKITLQWSGKKIHAGLPYTSTLELLDLSVQDKMSSFVGRIKAVHTCFINFYRTVGAKVGIGEYLDEVEFESLPNACKSCPYVRSKFDVIPFRDSSMPMNKAVALFNGVKYINVPSNTDREVNLKIVQEQPLPMCIRSVVIGGVVGER